MKEKEVQQAVNAVRDALQTLDSYEGNEVHPVLAGCILANNTSFDSSQWTNQDVQQFYSTWDDQGRK